MQLRLHLHLLLGLPRLAPPMFLWVTLLCALLCAPPCAQAQYKWTDRDGAVSYGDQPGADARNVERIGVTAGPADSGSEALARLPYEIRVAVHDFPVVLYAAPDCLPCDEARAFLKSHNVPFAERTVGSPEDLDAYQRLGGRKVIPAMTVGRQMLHGFEAGAWSDALAAAGYPRDLPLPRNWRWAAATPLAPPPPAPTDTMPNAAPDAAPDAATDGAPNTAANAPPSATPDAPPGKTTSIRQ